MALILAAAIAHAAPAAAQTHSLEVIFENDMLQPGMPGERFSDREYSHGLIVASERNTAPLWGGLRAGLSPCSGLLRRSGPCLQTRFEAGQKIFTPEIRDEVPSPLERPYAGWLYGSVTARVLAERRARSLRTEVGVTGPLSLGGGFQKVVHFLTGFPQPRGWEYQLDTEPGLLLEYEERYLFQYRATSGTPIADLTIASAATVGNVRTGVRGGFTVRAGHRLPHPWERSTAEQPAAIFGFGAVERLWTAHDLFLDGNTFGSSPSVDRIPFTGTVRAGIGGQLGVYRFTVAQVFEDLLYVTQPKPHRYSTITLTLHP